MPRGIDPTVLALMATGNLRMGTLVSIETLSGMVYAWTGYGTVVYNGNTYLGLGSLTNISAITEANSVISQGVTLTLNGVDPTNISEALTARRQCSNPVRRAGWQQQRYRRSDRELRRSNRRDNHKGGCQWSVVHIP